MTRYAVHFTDEAWAAIEAQIRYIAIDNKAPLNAAKWTQRLLTAVESLEQMPKRSGLDERQSRALATDVYRLVFERTYLLFYTVDDAARRVTVLSFRHGARQPGNG